jgi:hypothetical protein
MIKTHTFFLLLLSLMSISILIFFIFNHYLIAAAMQIVPFIAMIRAHIINFQSHKEDKESDERWRLTVEQIMDHWQFEEEERLKRCLPHNKTL